MKYLLSILCLFIFSCDSGGDDFVEVEGCTNVNACNYGENSECYYFFSDDLVDDGDEYHCGDLQVLEDIIDLYPNSWGDNPNPLHILLSIYWENGRIYHIDWGGGGTLLPESFGTLSNLEYLNLSNSAFISLPENFGNLSHLSYLSLANNQLTLLPDSFENLINLEELYLDYNQLTLLPDIFENLSNLEYLNLGFNQLTSLPENICNISDGTIYVHGNILCNQYNYSCIDIFNPQGAEQDQSNCCEGVNDEGETVPNWTTCP